MSLAGQWWRGGIQVLKYVVTCGLISLHVRPGFLSCGNEKNSLQILTKVKNRVG